MKVIGLFVAQVQTLQFVPTKHNAIEQVGQTILEGVPATQTQPQLHEHRRTYGDQALQNRPNLKTTKESPNDPDIGQTDEDPGRDHPSSVGSTFFDEELLDEVLVRHHDRSPTLPQRP